MSKPKFVPSAEQRKLVETLAAVMFPERDIAKLILNGQSGKPINRETLAKHFVKELGDGRVRAKAVVISKMFKKINEEFWPAMQFFLQTQCGFVIPREVTKEPPPLEKAKVNLSTLSDAELQALVSIRAKLKLNAQKPPIKPDEQPRKETRH